MKITNRTRRTLLGSRVKMADSWLGRLRGFLGRPEPQRGEGILLLPCNGIHTMGMTFNLDVLFLDGEGKVLDLRRSIPPWRITPRVRGGRYVLEVPVGTIDASGTEIGDELTWHEPLDEALTFGPRIEEGRRTLALGEERGTA
jgi:uncharacterized membrane protein (UPF0127 family)